MHKPIKYAEKGLSIAANGAWTVFNTLNKINQRPSFTPKWSDKPLLKSYEKVGEIKATILERDGKILMVKDCPIHGHFEDVMAMDTAFFKHLEEVFPGRDSRAHNDEKLHNHGSATIQHG